MRYENYKVEELVFLKGIYKDWTDEEKREFLDTCPESNREDTDQTVKDLERLLTAIESEEVKTNYYNELNKNSMKAYIKKHVTNFHYGRPQYLSENVAYLRIDGERKTLRYKSSVTGLINDYKNGGNLRNRFEKISELYKNREKEFAEKIERESYTALNAERITANKKAYALIECLQMYYPAGIKKGYTEYFAESVNYKIGYAHRFSRNNYGEILKSGFPLTEQQAENLSQNILDMSEKIKAIIDEYDPIFENILGKC
jgi:hypothetical protein